mmetsp:Transcript_5257/g.18356  ORF Transcript_5257/g.18356 Transcript_5257/m.18356 type:complete len:161 (-) Transcript_5257:33-515(-)
MGETSASVTARINELQKKVLDEGTLDDQFSQLQQLQDDGSPDFVSEVVSLYFGDSSAKLKKIRALMSEEPLNTSDLDSTIHQFKGSSASVGAPKIAALCAQFRELLQKQDVPGMRKCLEDIEVGYEKVKDVLQELLDLDARKKDLLEKEKDEPASKKQAV